MNMIIAEQELPILFLVLLPVVAFLFSSVGHGGASGYLALMALFGFSPDLMKPSALTLNLFVSSIAFIGFYRAGFFSGSLFRKFAITAVPLAFLGGLLSLDHIAYRYLLALCLLVAGFRILIPPNGTYGVRKAKTWQGLFAGGVIGLVSGLIGIGGGVLLSPLIVLMRWGDLKVAAGVSALFIFVNSAAGLTGQLAAGVRPDPAVWILVLLAIAGGIAGSYSGAFLFKVSTLRYLLASVLVLACLKLTFL
jgi:uncharacterized membrane protein YfcA